MFEMKNAKKIHLKKIVSVKVKEVGLFLPNDKE